MDLHHCFVLVCCPKWDGISMKLNFCYKNKKRNIAVSKHLEPLTKINTRKDQIPARCRHIQIQIEDTVSDQVWSSCYLFSVSFMMMFPRVEKTMKDILSIGLQTHSCVTSSSINAETKKITIQQHNWLILLVPDKLLCQLLHKGVNLCPVMLHTSRSEKYDFMESKIKKSNFYYP